MASIDQFLRDFTPGDDFDFDQFRAAALAEYEKDNTAWQAAVTTRDAKITETEQALIKAQAAAWEAYQNAPATTTQQTAGNEPDENTPEALRSRVFKPLNR